jgi:DNA adenine methylase
MKKLISKSYIKNYQKMADFRIQKPFLKWVGGKTQIIGNIISKLPTEMDSYHEIFLGGGSVLLAVLSLQRENRITIKNKIYASDINPHLINVYKNVQNNRDELYTFITSYMDTYSSIDGTEINRKPKTLDEAKTSKESYYYWMRKRFNTIDRNTAECSALFMIINKTCFRGMYREGPNGYNVPYGHYKKTPSVITKDELTQLSELIKDVEFVHCDFCSSIKKVNQGDFVYLDPPYAPENSKSFVGYVADGFTLDMHTTLFDSVKQLSDKGVKFLMSNAKVPLVSDSFAGYETENIVARRAINSKNPGSTTTEVLIYN